MEIKVNLSLTRSEFDCLRTLVNASAASIYYKFKDKDCSSMNEYQSTILSISDKF